MIQLASASGEEIYAIISKMEPVLEGLERGKAIIAMISVAVTLMDPQITPLDLQEGVKEVSQFLCLWLDGRGEKVEGLKVN